MRRFFLFWCLLLLGAARAEAQFGAPDLAPGEDFHVELGAMFFKPTPELRIETGALADFGGGVDFVEEFDIENKSFTEFRIVAKPGRKHKIRFSYFKMHYDEEATVDRTFTFGGRTFTLGVPASADLQWDMMRIGYEWDFVARDRGLVGFIAELKHNRVYADVAAAGVGSVEYEATAPVPTIGIIGRGYPHRLVSITGEFTGFNLDSEELEFELWDFDLYTTVSFGRNAGVQAGYRSIVAEYLVDDDAGDLKLKGLYIGGLIRF